MACFLMKSWLSVWWRRNVKELLMFCFEHLDYTIIIIIDLTFSGLFQARIIPSIMTKDAL